MGKKIVDVMKDGIACYKEAGSLDGKAKRDKQEECHARLNDGIREVVESTKKGK